MAGRSLETHGCHERSNETQHNDDENPSILARWMSDERYRNSQLAVGWTETYCRYLDYFTTVDITHYAPHHQRKQYESTITMKCNDPNLQSGAMRIRDDHRTTTKLVLGLREEEGRTNTYIPKTQRTKQKNTLHPELQQRVEWLSQQWEEYLSQVTSSSSSSSWTQNWWQNIQRWEDHQWHDHQWRDHHWWSVSEEIFLNSCFALRKRRFPCKRRRVKTAYPVARTILSSCQSHRTAHYLTHMRWLKMSQSSHSSYRTVETRQLACILWKNLIHIPWHLWTFLVFRPSATHRRWPRHRLQTRWLEPDIPQMRLRVGGGQSGPMADTTPNTGYDNKILHRRQQWAHADQFPVQEKQLQSLDPLCEEAEACLIWMRVSKFMLDRVFFVGKVKRVVPQGGSAQRVRCNQSRPRSANAIAGANGCWHDKIEQTKELA